MYLNNLEKYESGKALLGRMMIDYNNALPLDDDDWQDCEAPGCNEKVNINNCCLIRGMYVCKICFKRLREDKNG